MSVFGDYSRYYDLLYRDKDYSGEADFIRSLILEHHPRAASLLDLGCGTGRHALLLADQGYRTTGVDRSQEMLAEAERRLSESTPAQLAQYRASGATPQFLQGDLRTVRVGRTFDAVVSLFHVMSYQTSNADLKAAFATAKAHLSPGGVFIFDCWYGPAVLSDRPAVRVRRLEDERTQVTRIAEPVLHPNENSVDVNFHVLIKDKQSGEQGELRETHTMRYLFAPEVALLLETAGLRLKGSLEFLSKKALGVGTWTAVFIAEHDA